MEARAVMEQEVVGVVGEEQGQEEEEQEAPQEEQQVEMAAGAPGPHSTKRCDTCAGGSETPSGPSRVSTR